MEHKHLAIGLNGRRVTVKRRGRNRGGEIAKRVGYWTERTDNTTIKEPQVVDTIIEATEGTRQETTAGSPFVGRCRLRPRSFTQRNVKAC